MSKNQQIPTNPPPTSEATTGRSHGGRREGAGRKPSAIKTVVKRVPSVLVPMIDDMIRTLASSPIIKSPNLPLDAMTPANDDTDLSVLMSLAKVPAGLPAYNDGDSEEINLNDYLIGRPEDTFVVRCGGYSMLDAGIDKDDLLIIDRSVEPRHFDIVMADLGNEFTIKRLHKLKGGKLELHSENEADPHPNFSFKEGDYMMVVGVVMHIIKSMR